MKRYLVIGSGGREHAIGWKLAEGGVNEVWVAPGNPGIEADEDIAGCVELDVNDFKRLTQWVRDHDVHLTVVGPEAPLCAGIVDYFRGEQLAIFGPTMGAAELEGSKAFAKEIMNAAGVKTADYRVFDALDRALEYVDGASHPLVIKADGLAGGKGVVISETLETSRMTLQSFMVDERFGESSTRIVIEDFLEGPEMSFICITDGVRVLPLATSRDHKRLSDGDEGPNTGGMGAISPSPDEGRVSQDEIIESVIQPVLTELRDRGLPFTGFLYAGLMLTDDGPHVLEFNVRLGDPETQPLMLAMHGSLNAALEEVAAGRLESDSPGEFDHACCVVMASRGYPVAAETGYVIHGLGRETPDDIKVFHAGTGLNADGDFVNAGGRVLGVTARGASTREAIKRAYEAVSNIEWEGVHYRTDIGR